jgi:hypothetical protein
LLIAAALPSMPPDSRTGDGGTGAFYQAPAPKGPAGQLIRSEPLDRALAPKAAAQSLRMLYSSTNGFGSRRPIATSGAVYLPRGDAPAGGWPVIAWAHGTTGVADICAPSFAGVSAEDDRYLGGWLQHGYAVVATDYQGLGTPGPHPYMAARAAAFSVLDAVRAARQIEPHLARQTIVVGQSQGAHAALATGLYQPGYAPDVFLAGVVATGTPGEAGFTPQGSIAAGIAPIDPSTPRGIVRGLPMDRFDPWAIIYLYYFASYGLAQQGYRPETYLAPRGMDLLNAMARACNPPQVATFFKEKPPLSTIFKIHPTAHEALFVDERRYPRLHFGMPLFMGIGLADAHTAPELQYDVAKAACRAGTAVTVHFYPGQSHSGTVLPSQADSLPWVTARFAGEKRENNCARLTWPGRS